MSIHTYKCPNCSGGLSFDPKSQGFNCEYCESHFSKEEIEVNKPQEEEIQEEVETAFYLCPSCGAEVLTDLTTAATHCFYCHSAVVLSDRLIGNFKPDTVIPFTVSKEQAVEEFLKWMKKKWFIPKDFCSQRQLEKITGVYFPTWYADCEVEADLKAQATRVRVWQDSRFRYTETSFFDVSRSGEIQFKNIPKKALSKEESKLYESVLPFNEEKMQPFTSAYLSGFQAEKRDIESNTHVGEVDEEADRLSKQILKNSIMGYATVSTSSYEINKLETNWKYTLLPVWTLTYRDLDKTYYYVMNGQTGKLNGQLPVDRKKLKWVSLGLSVGVFLLLLSVNRGWIG